MVYRIVKGGFIEPPTFDLRQMADIDVNALMQTMLGNTPTPSQQPQPAPNSQPRVAAPAQNNPVQAVNQAPVVQPVVQQAAAAQTPTSIATQIYSGWSKSKGPKTDKQFMDDFNARVVVWFGKLNVNQQMAVLKAFKSLPFLGSEEEILMQESANLDKSARVKRGSGIESGRADTVKNYIDACKIADNFSGMQWKPNWTQFARSTTVVAITGAFQNMLFTQTILSKDIVYIKIWYVNLPWKQVLASFMIRMSAAKILLARHQNSAKQVRAGDPVGDNVHTFNNDCLAWDVTPAWTATTNNTALMTTGCIELSKIAVIPDWRVLLQQCHKGTPDNIQKDIHDKCLQTIFAMAKVFNYDTDEFEGSQVTLFMQKDTDNLFVTWYYGIVKYWRASLRNLTRMMNVRQASNPVRTPIMGIFTKA